MPVGPSVRPSQIFLKLRSVIELPLLPNRPRLCCRVSGLVREEGNANLIANEETKSDKQKPVIQGLILIFRNNLGVALLSIEL